MTRYNLCEWEENGYHDSYGYTAYYDDETGKVGKEETWATAFACLKNPPVFEEPTLEIVEKAVAWLANTIFHGLCEAEKMDVLEPGNIVRDTRVRFLVSGVYSDKKNKCSTPYEEGDAGTVFWTGHFGAFFGSGYNRRGRHNGRIGVNLDDGRVVFVDMKKVRLDREMLSEAELRERAERLARNCQFGKALSMKHAWDSSNWALSVLKTQKAS